MRVYFKNIDFLRFFLCLGIILRHLHNAILHNTNLSNISVYHNIVSNNYGNLPVDCFFIISGFFLFLTTNFAQNIYQFMKKKMIRLLPVIIFATVTFSVFFYLSTHKILIHTKDIWTLFMLQNVGFTNEYSAMANTWYVSVLFWVSCLLFYLYKIMDKKWFNILMVCTAFFCYSFYFNVSFGKSNIQTDYIFNYGVIRGIAGMSFGYIIYQIYKDLIELAQNKQDSFITKLIYTGLECTLFIFIFVNILYKNMSYKNPLLIILAFGILFILFIMKKGYFSRLLDNNFSRFIGRYTYSIYITHVLIRTLWITYFYKHYPNLVMNYPIQNVLIIFILAFLFGILTYHLIEKPATKYLTEKYK